MTVIRPQMLRNLFLNFFPAAASLSIRIHRDFYNPGLSSRIHPDHKHQEDSNSGLLNARVRALTTMPPLQLSSIQRVN